MDNRAGEMQAVLLAADLGSFSAAGRRLGLTPSAVSRLVSRLEDRLGTPLLLRSTRALRPTAEGEVYLARARRLLAEIEETERLVTAGALPRGPLRVSATVGFGTQCLVPLLPEFLARYPGITLDLSLSDGLVDLVEERTDIALRAGALRDSALKARLVLRSRRVVVASPAYLARHGTPRLPQDIAAHNCLGFNFRHRAGGWPFRDPQTGRLSTEATPGNLRANNGPTLRQLCLAGLGLARLARFHVQAEIDAGRLVPLLEEHNAEDVELIHALYVGHGHLASRIRAFIDFLVERMGGGAELR
ncbi:LysR substrate-binding domain-containing protein [Pseudoroseomonas cervicalis]|uniref:LysR substrate-binding domain-containing protein n=1 Tax=Teichococcus cervicalis TaxID=204525 RepID=UPI0022F199A8|nr:LysR substrate-binding domain-containing protein [Pseudoroseomonas cervicalis]WBV42306.1 LysR substrate-binding domain-containing protein [Pseudoroseomonas cervicalis]